MRVLITNTVLRGRTGTEIVTRDLALGLQALGAQPAVYTPAPGPLADELSGRGVPVFADIAAAPFTPDVIHGHHTQTTAIAVARFPQVPALFVCHDLKAWHDRAPLFPSIRRYLAISETFRRRLTSEGVDEALTGVVLNGIDTARFLPSPPPPAKPTRALAFAKNEEHLASVREACGRLDIALDVIGAAVGRVEAAPERLLPGYDLVFASALSAIEAMACGRPVVCCDGRGLAGFIDLPRYEAWRRENFGVPTFDQPLTADTVMAEIARYDAAAAMAVSERLRAEASLEQWAGRFLTLYAEIIAEAAAAPSSPEAHAAAVARHLQTWSPRVGLEWPWMAESARLADEEARARTGLSLLLSGEPARPGFGDNLRAEGFHEAESWGAWTRSSAPAITVRPPSSSDGLILELDYAPYLPSGQDGFEIALTANGLPVAAWTDGPAEEARRRRALVLPPEVMAGADRLTLQFRTSAPVSPLDRGGADARPLGFALFGLSLRPA